MFFCASNALQRTCKEIHTDDMKFATVACVVISGELVWIFSAAGILKDFQTLLTGIIALIIALFSGLALWHIEDKKRISKNMVARAMLGHALSCVGDYAKETLLYLYEYLHSDDLEAKRLLKIPELPSEAVFSQLCNAMEFANKQSGATKEIAKLVTDLQVHNSRLNSRDILSAYYIIDLQVFAVKLRQQVDNLFDYAREDSEFVDKIDKSNMRSAANVMVHDTNLFPFERYFPEAWERIKPPEIAAPA